MEVTIKQITAAEREYKDVWQLREDVLRKPLGRSLNDEDLSEEAGDTILVAMQGIAVIGCVMLRHISTSVLKLRQMAVAGELQGKSVGRLLLQAAEEFALQNGYRKIMLHARMVAVGFYKKMAYTTASGTFTEVGIPHVVMEKEMRTTGK